MTIVTQSLLDSPLAETFDLVHLDTSDHRDISNVERFDAKNVYLALRHGAAFALVLLWKRPAIVHVSIARNRLGFLRDALFLLPSRLMRRRVVLHLHTRAFGTYYEGESGWMRLLIRTAISPRWHAAVLSKRFQGTFSGLIDPERVFVVPNGIPDPGGGGDAGIRAPVVLHLSTMWSLKGVFDLLDAAHVVLARVPEARFVFAGGWLHEHERLRAVATVEQAALSDRIQFVGPVVGVHKTQLLQEAAVLALPSRHPLEGQPLVVLEALGAGTPVVGSDLGAIPEMVRDGVEGFIVPVGDVSGLAERLARLLDDRELRTEMGRAARRRYEQEYTMPVFVRRLADLWLAVAPPERTPA